MFWLMALVSVTVDVRGPLADIGPAPRTVLVDSAGKPFDLASVKGKVVLVSFVYTTCNGSCPATTSALVRIQKTARAGEAVGTFGRVCVDHARPQTRYARGPDPLCQEFRRRPGPMAFSDRAARAGRVRHRRVGHVGQDRPRRSPRPSVADLSARSPGPPAGNLQSRVPRGRFRPPRRASVCSRKARRNKPPPRANTDCLLPTAYCLLPTAYLPISKTA